MTSLPFIVRPPLNALARRSFHAGPQRWNVRIWQSGCREDCQICRAVREPQEGSALKPGRRGLELAADEFGAVDMAANSRRRLLHRGIGISPCKNSLCNWCAVGLMRPTVARAQAIAGARTRNGMAPTLRSSPTLIIDAQRRGESFPDRGERRFRSPWPHEEPVPGSVAAVAFDNRHGSAIDLP